MELCSACTSFAQDLFNKNGSVEDDQCMFPGDRHPHYRRRIPYAPDLSTIIKRANKCRLCALLCLSVGGAVARDCDMSIDLEVKGSIPFSTDFKAFHTLTVKYDRVYVLLSGKPIRMYAAPGTSCSILQYEYSAPNAL
jgi:hypothetical protein